MKLSLFYPEYIEELLICSGIIHPHSLLLSQQIIEYSNTLWFRQLEIAYLYYLYAIERIDTFSHLLLSQPGLINHRTLKTGSESQGPGTQVFQSGVVLARRSVLSQLLNNLISLLQIPILRGNWYFHKK